MIDIIARRGKPRQKPASGSGRGGRCQAAPATVAAFQAPGRHASCRPVDHAATAAAEESAIIMK